MANTELLDLTISEMLREQTKKNPNQDFMVYSDRDLRFTYAAFDARVDALACALLAIGLKKGDHLGIWATNVPDWLSYMFAATRIGVVTVTINTSYKLHELEYVIKQSDIRMLCISDGMKDSQYVSMIKELIPELDTCQRGALVSEKFPELKQVVFIGPEKYRGLYSTHELLLLGQHIDIARVHEVEQTLNCHEVINMQYTSGTTGFPKGVMLSHHNILNNGYFIGQCMKYSEKEKVCLPVPLFHCFGIVLGVMAVLSHGATHVMVESFDPLLVLASVHKEKCTSLYGVPTMFIAELNHPMFNMFDMSSLRTGIMAGSLCPIDVMKAVMSKMNLTEITSVYGLTETSPGMTQSRTDDPMEIRATTVGKELPHIEVKVLDPETGEECPPGVQGEMCCRGYNVMKGYYKNPEATAEIIDANGFLHSGDLGIKDEAGYFKITGRIKDMIIRGGENIYPKEIEEFLRQMSEIKDIQVAGVKDKRLGEITGAFIILHEGKTLTEEDVIEYCRGKIAKYKFPQLVLFVDSFPMTASGKIQKFKLSEIGEAHRKSLGIE